MRCYQAIPVMTLLVLLSCANAEQNNLTGIAPASELPKELKDYWYNGTAEITSFSISQARYGELHEGTSVMIFVTEDFSPEEFTKAEKSGKETIPVLKLNFTKNFVTGIYPYSVMTSSFIPFERFEHAVKVSASIQEWCGHVYMELLRKKKLYYSVLSYFEDENVKDGELSTAWMEDEIWSMIRVYPDYIPEGKIEMIPAFSYLRFMHLPLKTYECTVAKTSMDSGQVMLTMSYPELDREMKIYYQDEFPRLITGWNETYPDGFGDNKQTLTSTGTKMKTIRSAYWTKNKEIDSTLRNELGLE